MFYLVGFKAKFKLVVITQQSCKNKTSNAAACNRATDSKFT